MKRRVLHTYDEFDHLAEMWSDCAPHMKNPNLSPLLLLWVEPEVAAGQHLRHQPNGTWTEWCLYPRWLKTARAPLIRNLLLLASKDLKIYCPVPVEDKYCPGLDFDLWKDFTILVGGGGFIDCNYMVQHLLKEEVKSFHVPSQGLFTAN